MATRGEIRTRMNLLLADASDQKWTAVQKDDSIRQAVLDGFPWFYDIAVVDGGTGFVTASGTLDYTPTLTGITEEGILKLEMEPGSSSEPYTIMRNWEYLNVAGTPTIRLGENPTAGRKLRATYRTAKAVPTADGSEVDLPENYVVLYACFYCATNYLPKGARIDVSNYQRMATSWQSTALAIRRARAMPPPSVPIRQRRFV